MSRAIAGQEADNFTETFRVEVLFPDAKNGDAYLFVFYGTGGKVVKVWRPDRRPSPDNPMPDYSILGDNCTCPGFEHHTYCKHERFAKLAREAWGYLNDEHADQVAPAVFDYRQHQK